MAEAGMAPACRAVDTRSASGGLLRSGSTRTRKVPAPPPSSSFPQVAPRKPCSHLSCHDRRLASRWPEAALHVLLGRSTFGRRTPKSTSLEHVAGEIVAQPNWGPRSALPGHDSRAYGHPPHREALNILDDRRCSCLGCALSRALRAPCGSPGVLWGNLRRPRAIIQASCKSQPISHGMARLRRAWPGRGVRPVCARPDLTEMARRAGPRAES